MQLLLNDDQLAGLDKSATALPKTQAGPPPTTAKANEPIPDLWNEEGDDFFGHSASMTGLGGEVLEEDDGTPGPSVVRPKKRQSGATGAPRGRRPKAGGSKRKSAMNSNG